MEKVRTPSQILTSSASSFMSAQSSTSTQPLITNEQIFQSFLQFLNKGSDQISQDKEQIKQNWIQLTLLIQEALSNDSTDVAIFSLLDSILAILNKIFEEDKSKVSNLLYESKEYNRTISQTCSTVERQNMPRIRLIIQKIIFQLFTGFKKDIYAQIILSLNENVQRVFMHVIDYQMKKYQGQDFIQQQFFMANHDQTQHQINQILNQISVLKNSRNFNVDIHEMRLKRNRQNSQLPVVQLIQKVLNLEEVNIMLVEELQKIQNSSKLHSKEQVQLGNTNKILSDDNKNLHIKISSLLNEIQNLETQKQNQIAKLQKKWQSRIQILQKNKKQHISELIEINQATQKKFEDKINDYEQRLEDKRSKIKKLQQNEQKLQNNLRQEKRNLQVCKKQIEDLNEALKINRQKLNDLQLLKDSLAMQIDIRNNRIQDLKMLLVSDNNRMMLKSTQFIPAGCTRQCCLNLDTPISMDTPDLDQSTCSKEWKRQSHISKFQTLAFNRPQYINQNDTGYSWFKNTFINKDNKKCIQELAALSQSDLNKHYETHFSFLVKKTEAVQKQNQNLRLQLKKAKDYKYENSKLIKSLLQHQSYRGQENQILIGCLYELRGLPNFIFKQISQNELSQQRIAERIKIIKENHFQTRSSKFMKNFSMQSLEEGFSDEQDDNEHMKNCKLHQTENLNFFSERDTEKLSAYSEAQSYDKYK